MVERKDITEMSFEEFFGKSEEDAGRASVGASSATSAGAEHDATMGFGGASPKINYRDGRFSLYLPRYKGDGRFDVAIETGSEVIPAARLDSTKLRDHRLTRAATIDLTELGVCPLDEFVLTIDGAKAFVNKPRRLMLFSDGGMPVSHASGSTIAVHRKGTQLRVAKAVLQGTDVFGDVIAARYDVSPGGYVRADSGESQEAEPASEKKAEKKADEKPKGAPKAEEPKKAAPAKKKAKKVAVKVAASLPQGIPDASVSVAGSVIPLFREPPVLSVSIEGCEPSECTVSVTDSAGEMVFGRVPIEGSRMELRNGASDGLMTVAVEKGGKALKTLQYFLIPDFACDPSGRNDIPEDTRIAFTMFGQEYSKDIYDDDLEGPYYHGDSAYNVLWSIPVVTYDLGEGPRPYEPLVLTAEDLTSSMLVVKVRGAAKKKIYFGPEGGKKEDITKGWDSDSVQINLPPLLDQVYSSTNTYCFYISVNSFPNRKFIQITNPEKVKASVENGSIIADVTAGRTELACVIYLQDKTSKEFPLAEGRNEIPVPDNAVEAEVRESFKGGVRRVIPLLVRPLPFISYIAGDLWLYVSKDKRLPLPDGLIKNGTPDLDAVAKWHGKIVGMNPELRSVSLAEMKRAFTDYKG